MNKYKIQFPISTPSFLNPFFAVSKYGGKTEEPETRSLNNSASYTFALIRKKEGKECEIEMYCPKFGGETSVSNSSIKYASLLIRIKQYEF